MSDDQTVKIRHPETGGETTVSLSSYHKVWEKKGWRRIEYNMSSSSYEYLEETTTDSDQSGSGSGDESGAGPSAPNYRSQG